MNNSQAKQLASLICIAFSLAIFYYTQYNSWFLGQDFDHLVLLQDLSFNEYLFTSIDIHFPLPLHRLFCWLFYQQLNMNYAAATAFLIALHCATTYLLYNLLENIAKSTFNIFLAGIYFTNFYTIDLFTWWSAGLHRFPYLLCMISACLILSKLNNQKVALKAISIAGIQVIALGFFEKAALLPLYLALTMAAAYSSGTSRPNRAQIITLLVCSAISLSYILLTPKQPQDRPDILAALTAGMEYMGAFIQSIFPTGFSKPLIPAAILLGGLSILVTSLINPKTLITTTLALASIAANIAPIAYSSRITLFGNDVLLIHRYFFDNLFILILTIAAITASINKLKATKPSTLTAAIAISAVLSFSIATPEVTDFYSRSSGGPQAADYINNFKSSLDSINTQHIKVLDNKLPSFIYADIFGANMSASRVLREIDSRLEFTNSDADYFITDDGSLSPTK